MSSKVAPTLPTRPPPGSKSQAREYGGSLTSREHDAKGTDPASPTRRKPGKLVRKNSSMAFSTDPGADGISDDTELELTASSVRQSTFVAQKSIRKRALALIGGLGLEFFRRVYRIVIFALIWQIHICMAIFRNDSELSLFKA